MNLLLAGAGRYIQGKDAAKQTGLEAKRLGLSNVLVLGGEKALSAAFKTISSSLGHEGVTYIRHDFTGYCSDRQVDMLSNVIRNNHLDGVIGVGGGKALDTAKAVAFTVNVPVICIPTSAATCSAYSPLSVFYTDNGRPLRVDFYHEEVRVVLTDTKIISEAPERLLASGIADSFAKRCEYGCLSPNLRYGDKTIGLFCGYHLAGANDEIMLSIGAEAYESVKCRHVTSALEDAVFSAIALTGAISGIGGYAGRGGARFAIAHGLNDALRAIFPQTARNWLHGEVVGVGVIAQFYCNMLDRDYINNVICLFRKMNLPVSLQNLGIMGKDAISELKRYIVNRTAYAKNDIKRIYASLDKII